MSFFSLVCLSYYILCTMLYFNNPETKLSTFSMILSVDSTFFIGALTVKGNLFS